MYFKDQIVCNCWKWWWIMVFKRWMHWYHKFEQKMKLYHENRLKRQGFEQKLLFYSLISKIHMDLVRNLTIIILNQLIMQICISGENLKLIAFFFPKIWTILLFLSNLENSVGDLWWRAFQTSCSGNRPLTKNFLKR